MVTATTSPLTPGMIESVINALPIQARIMLHLILLQHFDVTDEEINYMTMDRPDPRCVAGTKPTYNILTQEAIKAVRDKRDQYLRHVRLKRERTWLQCECLKNLLQGRVAMADRAAHLLATRYNLATDAIDSLKAEARTALYKPAVRALDQRWEAGEISTEDYQQQRLAIEMQAQLRLAERYRKRLDLAERERHTADYSSLQDHEIAHIWGIPAGSLAARKVKHMTLFLQGLQAALQEPARTSGSSVPPLDLWKETFTVLATRPVERSRSTYDGLEQTEANLIERLTLLAWGGIGEDVETKFWLSMVQGGSSNAVHSEVTRNLFGIQRLAAILGDLDLSPESLDQVLLARATPKPRDEQVELLEKKPTDPTNDMREHVLKSMFGEQHPDLYGGGKW
ncbi:MAG: hypothetical protein GDA67_04970 [Nitrospira sp. CR1.3]|nr:hypothetical protein [Nitrospira sp. CR1.3]